MNLFWQYPVITEKCFYTQNNHNSDYLGMPWATILDKHVCRNHVFKVLKQNRDLSKPSYTCCQHIHYTKLIDLFSKLNITTLYASHKQSHIHRINDIILKPCPLYAVNFEDGNRNKLFQGVDFVETDRPVLYSFIGANMNHYITRSRKILLSMDHDDDCVVTDTGKWHFESTVYSDMQNDKGKCEVNVKSVDNYNDMLLKSKFSLCPAGAGPNSIRFWESLAVASIPVLISDTLQLPEHDLWESAIVRVEESNVAQVPNILRDIHADTQHQMRINCLKIYDHFRTNYTNR